MNRLDLDYQNLLKDVLENGTKKETRNGDTISVFGRQIRHSMKDGFPLLTTKKMPFKTIVTELLWFLRGDTNIKYLVDNNCNIWNGDAYKAYVKYWEPNIEYIDGKAILTQEEFINKIKTDDEFANKFGELGPVYGKQWRKWDVKPTMNSETGEIFIGNMWVDQIANLINDLKTNPDSRRLMVNAWNVSELESMVLPPCHFSFQVYTRELSLDERYKLANINNDKENLPGEPNYTEEQEHSMLDELVPKRAISLMWNQRSVDTFLGLPFNIASYGLLLEIIAKAVNMVPDELIGNLGDVHLYSNHIEQAKEQIGRELTDEELKTMYSELGLIESQESRTKRFINKEKFEPNIPKRTREPFPLPKLNINTEFWPTEGGSCGEGPIDALAVFNGFFNDDFCKCLLEEDIQLSNYQSHSTIKAPLSN